MRQVVERLEGRMGKLSPQVGKAWMSLARMYQHLSTSFSAAPDKEAAGGKAGGGSETDEERLVREGAVSALARAMAVAKELSAEHPQLVPRVAPNGGDPSQRGFAYLVERVQRQRQRLSDGQLMSGVTGGRLS